MTVIASQEQAQERAFVGSPTILINGVDPFGADDVISAPTAASDPEPI